MHLGQFAVGGNGLLFVEATGTEPEGRITPGCVGLWSDENEAALKRVLDFCNAYGNTPVGIQLAHAGRKASADVPWKGGKPLSSDNGAWQTVGDWVEGGWDIEGSVAYTHELKKRGCDFIDVSSGGNSPDQKIPVGPGYQTPFAERIRRDTGIATMAVGKITDAIQAEHIVRSGQADMVALARGMLYDPRWAWHAAQTLGGKAAFPPQYQRCHPALAGEPVPGNPPPPEKAKQAAGVS
jgi:2,4-dienoyl-CoA reductase-like NADH-dependent reductase (Old Yellow Enzyme family)